MNKPKKIKIKPALCKRTGEPLLVRDPRSLKALPADGALVSPSPFWSRSLMVGDVELVEAGKPVEPVEPVKAGKPNKSKRKSAK